MSAPGVYHIEAHLSEELGYCVYDSSQITPEEMLQLLVEKAGNFPATLVNDFPMGGYSGVHQMRMEQNRPAPTPTPTS